jgi:hypothetical protein
MPQLDETLLTLPGVYSFQAALSAEDGAAVLNLTLFCPSPVATGLKEAATTAVHALMATQGAEMPRVHVHIRPPEALRWDSTGMVKRTISTN